MYFVTCSSRLVDTVLPRADLSREQRNPCLIGSFVYDTVSLSFKSMLHTHLMYRHAYYIIVYIYTYETTNN